MDTTQTIHAHSLPVTCNCRCLTSLHCFQLFGSYFCVADLSKLVCCRAPAPRRQPVSRHQRALRRQDNQIQQSCHVQQRSHKHMHITCEAATAELATEKATVKIGTRGSPLALAQAYMTRDFLKVGFLCLVWQGQPAQPCCGVMILAKQPACFETQQAGFLEPALTSVLLIATAA